MPKKLTIYAPNVHTGGGLVLLVELLANLPPTDSIRLFLDARLQNNIKLPQNASITWSYPRISSRLMTEFLLWENNKQEDTTVLCFHGLPPLFPLQRKAVVFVQNRLLIGRESLTEYPLRIRLRIGIERLLSRKLQSHCSHYIVQTPTMEALLKKWLRKPIPVSTIAFSPSTFALIPLQSAVVREHFDFLYVASGEAHKNHLNLLKAWRLLAEADFLPSLVLTIDPHTHPLLAIEIARYREAYGLKLVNKGSVDYNDMRALYQASSALIYPSRTESFGLPLIEASCLGLPVLAPELDYVRDVVQPVETFDPNSPVSIARAVKRFLNYPEPAFRIRTTQDFIAEVLK